MKGVTNVITHRLVQAYVQVGLRQNKHKLLYDFVYSHCTTVYIKCLLKTPQEESFPKFLIFQIWRIFQICAKIVRFLYTLAFHTFFAQNSPNFLN